MPLESTDSIDLARTTDDGRLVLAIIDAGITDEPQERYDLLIAKLRTYVNFALSDQLSASVPGKTAEDVDIEVITVRAATPQMLQVTRVRPQSHPGLEIPVRFVMDPTAAPVTSSVPEDLTSLAYRAIDLALGAMTGDDPTKAILAVGVDGLQLTMLPDCPSEEYADAVMQKVACDAEHAVQMVAMVGQAVQGRQDILLVKGAQRGDAEAWRFALDIVPVGEDWTTAGTLRVVEQVPNEVFNGQQSRGKDGTRRGLRGFFRRGT